MEKKICELFDFMTSNEAGKFVFVSDFHGWTECAKIPGFTSFAAMEGNGIKSEKTGESYFPQYETVRRGNHLKVELRGEKDKKITLGSLFPNQDVVVVTSGDSLTKIAPIFPRRSETIDWIMQVHQYCMERQKSGNPVPWYWESDMISLATYLFQNQEDKIVDQSVYDRLTNI